jgi:hypothetical protein
MCIPQLLYNIINTTHRVNSKYTIFRFGWILIDVILDHFSFCTRQPSASLPWRVKDDRKKDVSYSISIDKPTTSDILIFFLSTKGITITHHGVWYLECYSHHLPIQWNVFVYKRTVMQRKEQKEKKRLSYDRIADGIILSVYSTLTPVNRIYVNSLALYA